ncbi:C-type lectin domain family 14 member A [Salarias fasciatus]|uniref:C-type lectin domain family 14 member A n=1 Tax=Salarias fasciatus TaxID=181472 RepID=UPI001176F226|nr:endosialin-like [Salarias fasciatus]XP_029973544.1 endosialin-like [Salarias fasciatus]
MASRSCPCWAALCISVFLLTGASADPSPQYVLHQTASHFSEASSRCSPGELTTLTTQQEVSEVLAVIAASALPPGDFVFWIGLKKERKECVVPSQPLRGFRWIQDGSQESQVSQWMEEPQRTCTTVRCAALKGTFDGSSVTTWGLVPGSCKHSYKFICKLQSGVTAGLPESPERAATPEPQPETTEPQLIPQTQEPTTSEPEPETLQPSTPGPAGTTPAASQPERPAPELEQTKVYELQPGSGPEPEPSPGPVPGSGSGSGSNPCHNPIIPSARSLSPDPQDSSRVRVECWSSSSWTCCARVSPPPGALLERIAGQFQRPLPAVRRRLPEEHLRHCEDVDECRTKPCKHNCVNTEGSFRCVCCRRNVPDAGTSPCDDTVTVENADALSGVLIPVLDRRWRRWLVLVVVVAVTVKVLPDEAVEETTPSRRGEEGRIRLL